MPHVPRAAAAARGGRGSGRPPAPRLAVQASARAEYPLRRAAQGLESNGLVRHSHLLTGYMGTASILEAVAAVARALREANPQLTYGGPSARGPSAARPAAQRRPRVARRARAGAARSPRRRDSQAITCVRTAAAAAVCDPVLGDEGRCYVSEELIGAYK